jgi:adenosylcobinamide kinase/adenosylcobinamide-phosphate guanylyltransferase
VGRKLSVLLRAQLSAGGIATRPLPTHRRVLVTGGSRSGKSAFAEDLLAGSRKVTYVAAGTTVDAADGEWADRVRAHRERRPAAWQTLETLDVAGAFALGGAFLVDGLGTWLTGIIDRSGGWDNADVARSAVASEAAALITAYEQCEGTAVIVTDEVGSGVVPAHASGRLFRDELGRLNATVAAAADEVWLVTAGIGSRLR